MASNNAREQGQAMRESILKAIIAYIKKHGYPPTNREIGAMVGLKSTSTVYSHLLKMKDLGMIETDGTFGAPRAIRVPGYKFVKEESMEKKSKHNLRKLECGRCGNQLFKSRVKPAVKCCWCGYVNEVGVFRERR